MGINLKSPAGFTSGVLISDTYQAPNGSPDSVVSGLTKVNGVPVSAALEINSTQGALLYPRMTTTERDALPIVVNGMAIYNLTTGTFQIRAGDEWSDLGGGSGEFDKVLLSDGTNLAPSLSFKTNTTMGVFRSGDDLGLVAGNAGVVSVYGNAATPGAIRFYNELNTKYVQIAARDSVTLTSDIAFDWPTTFPTYNFTPLVCDTFGNFTFNDKSNIFATGAIQAADFQGMYNTPLEILVPLPATQAYIIHDFQIHKTHVTNTYLNGGDIFLQYGNSDTGAAARIKASGNIPATLLTDGASRVATAAGSMNGGTPVAPASVVEKGIYLSNDTAAFINGNGIGRITVWYSIVNNVA